MLVPGSPFRSLVGRALLLVLLAWAALAPAAEVLTHQPVHFDGQGRFTVEVDVPAGSRHALLEAFVPGPPVAWRTLVSGPLDGRAARVIFRLPPAFSASEIVRARTGPETTVPAAELDDPALYTVLYESPISERQKIAFLSSASAKMGEWSSLPLGEAQARLIAWAETDPLVESAEVSPEGDNVTMYFTDGDLCLLLKEPRGTGDDTAPPLSAASVPPAETAVSRRGPVLESGSFTKAATGLGLPASKRAIAGTSLESSFPNSAPVIGDWLAATGYDVQRFGFANVRDIKTWSTDASRIGVLFWHIHGCTFKRRDGTPTVGLVTREVVTDVLSDGEYSSMKKAGELTMASYPDKAPFYVLTGAFVRNRLHFAANSLVVMDSCYAANEDLANAFIAAGAGSYASWDWESGKQSGDSCRKIFDRMLGMNEEAPVSAVKERSFSQPIVETWMWRKKYDFDPSPKYPNQARSNAQLFWKHHPATPAHILKPTIIRILNHSGPPGGKYSMLWIEGEFGDDPGEGKRNVTWGGQLQQVVEWGPNRIYTRVPNPAPVGNVRVLVNRGFNGLSNEVPITQWTVPFTWIHDDAGSLTQRIDLNVKFRADLHGERTYPEEAVKYSTASFWCIADCTGTLSASGNYSPMEGVTLSYSGGSTLKSFDMGGDEAPPGHLVLNSGQVRGDGTFLAFHLSGAGEHDATYTYVLPDGGSFSQTVPTQAGFNGSDYFAPLPSFNPASYVFRAGSKTINLGTESNATLSWPATTAVAVPTTDTPR